MNRTQPGGKYLSAILSAILATVATGHANNARAAVIAVANCNDSGPGSLRSTIANAASGDTIDMSSLACREIDLTSGAIAIAQRNLTLVGGPPGLMRVDGNRNGSVFRHSGTGWLRIRRLNIADGDYSRHGIGHNIWWCLTCPREEPPTFGPPLSEHCDVLDGPAAVRISSSPEPAAPTPVLPEPPQL